LALSLVCPSTDVTRLLKQTRRLRGIVPATLLGSSSARTLAVSIAGATCRPAAPSQKMPICLQFTFVVLNDVRTPAFAAITCNWEVTNIALEGDLYQIRLRRALASWESSTAPKELESCLCVLPGPQGNLSVRSKGPSDCLRMLNTSRSRGFGNRPRTRRSEAHALTVSSATLFQDKMSETVNNLGAAGFGENQWWPSQQGGHHAVHGKS